MADDTTTSSSEAQAQGDRGGRGPGPGRGAANREPGGFRIRLSDNEMRAARAVQEAFGLRSTVAALGFSIRTIAQLLDDGQLDGLVAQQRAQNGNRGEGPRPGRRGEPRPEERAPRIDPFARPAKPAPASIPAAVLSAEQEVSADAADSELVGSEPVDSDAAGAGDGPVEA